MGRRLELEEHKGRELDSREACPTAHPTCTPKHPRLRR